MNSLYIHIPYCRTRCGYCDFHSSTCGDDMEEYVSALCLELEQQKYFFEHNELGTLYFGGGTPSLLSITQLEKVMDKIKSIYRFEKDIELTLESNPDDLNEEYLRGLRHMGFNRLSMGIQSFNNDDLNRIGRRHSAQQAIDAIKRAQQCGFDNISGDLIFALPEQTMEKWQANLKQLFELDLQHISCYNLIYEEGTAFYQKLEKGIYQEISDEDSLKMFQELISQAKQNGFEHYETSNFAKKDLYSKHNSNYWTGASYLGIGAGAHSYNGKSREWNISDNKAYIPGILNSQANKEIEQIDQTTAYNEFIMTGLRTMWGCNLEILEQTFGKEMLDFCLRTATSYLKSGQLIKRDNHLIISAEAIFISDSIMSDLMIVDE